MVSLRRFFLFLILSSLGLSLGCAALAPVREKEAPKAEVQPPSQPQQQIARDDLDKLKSDLARLQAQVDWLREENARLKEKFEQRQPTHAPRFRTIISLKNGSIIFGEIIGEDEDELRVETEIGILPLRRDWIQDIVYSERKPASEEKAEAKPTQEVKEEPKPKPPARAECVLLGEIREEKEKVEGATVYLGKVKNVGGRRADFVRVIFTVKDIYGRVIRSDAAFVSGSRHAFKSGITSDASLEPQQVGSFQCLVPIPARFITSYSYAITWEEYD